MIPNAPGPARETNRRILIIDDNPKIHGDFQKIFALQAERSPKTAVEERLFEAGPVDALLPHFTLDSALQGEAGLTRVEQALNAGRPYAMAFIDVRMFPGWDGVATTEQIWKIDPNLQVVICTAYTDYTWEAIFRQIGQSDRLVVLKKPFEMIEVLQLAQALTEKWSLARESRRQMEALHRLNRLLQEQIAERRRLERELLEVSVQEQQRIGRDLHDGLCQQLTAIAYLNKSLEEKLARLALPEAAEATAISGHLRTAVQQSRAIARGLLPVRLESNGLASALEELAAATRSLYRLECESQCEPAVSLEDNQVATQLYFIATEAVANAVKHARPQRIQLQLRATSDRLVLRIINDGEPFLEPAAAHVGLGLRIMRYRADLVGGRLDFDSHAGKTTVSCTVLVGARSAAENPDAM